MLNTPVVGGVLILDSASRIIIPYSTWILQLTVLALWLGMSAFVSLILPVINVLTSSHRTLHLLFFGIACRVCTLYDNEKRKEKKLQKNGIRLRAPSPISEETMV